MSHQSQAYQSVTRVLGGALALLLAALGLQVVLPQLSPRASAASFTMLCSGFTQCNAKGMSASGYHQHWGHMYWRMYSGRNCVNYVAYRMVAAGMPDKRPWSGSGNATNWGVAMKSITDKTPAVGSVAWWRGGAPGAGSLGHVAYVEKVVSSSEIVISESNWGSDFSWRRITKSGYWPTGFIHFRDQELENTSLPTISGAPKVGVRLQASTGRWTPSGASFSYQWLQDGEPIAGQTRPGFLLIRHQIGHRISVRVTAKKGTYQSSSVVSAQTAAVQPGDLTVTQSPTLSGTPQVGQKLTVDPGEYAPSGATTAVQWYADGDPIQGATGTTLTPTQALADTMISATVTATRMGHNPLAVATNKLGPVIGTPVRLTHRGAIRGQLRPGKVLTVRPGTVSPASAHVSYQWRRNGVPISGATSTTYRLTSADIGKKITVMLGLSATHHRSTQVKYVAGVAKVYPRMTIATSPGKNRIGIAVHVWAPGANFDGRMVKLMTYSRTRWVKVVDGVARTTYTKIPAGRRLVRATFANPLVTPRTVQVATRVSR
ncbi:CHAP domain-containing protein [Nocardioides sp. DS6]|uniref:CHAP domain-containing protein n=1 Tax=Nocardioides eburneus TaxID=3231482 RepID=A0ABV3SZG3_9ACTN